MTINFPMYGYYVRRPSRLYTISDFADGEYVRYLCACESRSATAKGYAWYIDINGNSRMIHISDVRDVGQKREVRQF